MNEADIVRVSLIPIVVVGGIAIWRTGRMVIGRWLILIGACHLSGLWVGRFAITRIAQGGLWGQGDSAVGRVAERADQELIVWFTLWGLWTIVLGEMANALERHGARLPPWIGWQLIAINAFAAVLIPKGGFWWVLLPATLIVRDARRRGM